MSGLAHAAAATPAAVEFRRASHWNLIAAVTALTSMLGLLGAPRAFVAFAVVTFPWMLFETYFQWRTPLIAFTGSEIVIRLAWIRRERRIAYAEVAAWAHAYPWITFETLHGRRHHFHTQVLAPEERARLLAYLESLDLGQPGFAGVTEEDVRRRRRRVRWALAAMWVALAGFLIALSVWTYFQLAREQPQPDSERALPPVSTPGRPAPGS